MPRIISKAGRANSTLKNSTIAEKMAPRTIRTIIKGRATAPRTRAIIPMTNPTISIASSVNIFIPHFIKISFIYIFRRNRI